ncbi:hypothetical protein BN1723_016848 [Verticillium longisporum]|uniref:Uncharacterized protein n=3 Tax=Verticillium TaxID=1036719 RepID=A0A0G4NP81_VERLO|nr:hypothetical protein BN1723_016848 [Verticillium longisporum]
MIHTQQPSTRLKPTHLIIFHPTANMKTSFAVILTTLTAVLAAPQLAADAPIEARQDNCFHPSSCSAFWSGKCQDYCDTRGFSHMTGDGCGGLRKKCCCIRP